MLDWEIEEGVKRHTENVIQYIHKSKISEKRWLKSNEKIQNHESTSMIWSQLNNRHGSSVPEFYDKVIRFLHLFKTYSPFKLIFYQRYSFNMCINNN